jgi:DNA-binding NtrC family response regulator
MSTKPIVLVVDSGFPGGESLASVLDSTQFHTLFVDNPEDAMVHVESPVDLVLSRVALDEPRGRELFDRWRARRPETPFVLLTDGTGTEEARRAVEVGVTGFISLPSDSGDISMQISKWLDQDQQAEQHRHDENHSNGAAARPDLASAIRIPPGTTLEDLERVAVEQALTLHHGNRTHAAKELGISVRTLQRKLKAWGEMRAAKGEPAMGPMRELPGRDEQAARTWNANPAPPRQTPQTNQPNYRPRRAGV